MSSYTRSILLLFIFTTTALFAQARVVAAVSSIKGDVKIKPVGQRKYESAYKGQMIKTGDWLKTEMNVFVAIVFLDGSNVKIHESTEIEIKSSRVTAKELKTQMYLAQGQAWSKVSKQKNGEFKVKTPTAVASVKGTEFNIDFDEDEEATTLTVFEGEVAFANELGEILAGAMEASKASAEEQPEKYKIKPEQLPSWQKTIEPTWGFKLTPDRSGKHPVNQPMKVTIQAMNTKTNEAANSFIDEIQVTTDSELLLVSADGSSWSSSLNMNLKSGRGTVHVKGGSEGRPSIIVGSGSAESKKLTLQFYQSKSQKRAMEGKLSRIASKKGLGDVSEVVKGKSLKSSTVASGEANVDEVLQKVDTGEYEIVEVKYVENPDGSVSVRLVVKPKGASQ